MSNNKKSKKSASGAKNQKVLFEIELLAAILFSLLSLSFNADISLLAFPIALIFTGITLYFSWFSMLRKKDSKKCFCVLKLTQYLPYVLFLTFILRRAGKNGTSFFYDLITVILWCIVFVTSLIISHKMNDKRIKDFTADWPKPKNKYDKPLGGARVAFEIVDWIDALVQAIFIVLLVQIFILQLYAIPSESMVPTFLIKDRVAVSKIDCGPKFPLTDIGLPDMRKYKRGDTIVLRNPHYSMDRKSEVKTVVSQLIYMLTFMQVNTNKDENGELKADPLVKRICGEPGEQLVMQDGVLYTRTKKSDDFEANPMDAKYATWDLTKIDKSLLSKVETYPLSDISFDYNKANYRDVLLSASENYQTMLDLEEERRSYDLDLAAIQAQELVREFNSLAYNSNLIGDFSQDSLFEYDLFTHVSDITNRLMNQKGGKEWFQSFMTSWIPAKDQSLDMYAMSNYKLNVMTKITFGKLVVRYAQIFRDGKLGDSNYQENDSVIKENLQKAEILNKYIQSWLDSRNMPLFPANDANGNPQYIPKDCYFMMGDNRFNSLDLRHANDYSLKNLTPSDDLSVKYYSIIQPQYINKKYIIGKPVFRFWPTYRMARVR
ncbi:MAG: signal peptidase I [Treponema sp.]|nr:signal peptidase I [Treponema sp.]